MEPGYEEQIMQLLGWGYEGSEELVDSYGDKVQFKMDALNSMIVDAQTKGRIMELRDWVSDYNHEWSAVNESIKNRIVSMKPNPSIKEQIEAEFLQYTAELKHGFNGTTIDDHAEAILRIIESEVIGEDEDVRPEITEWLVSGSRDAAEAVNALRESQREKLRR